MGTYELIIEAILVSAIGFMIVMFYIKPYVNKENAKARKDETTNLFKVADEKRIMLEQHVLDRMYDRTITVPQEEIAEQLKLVLKLKDDFLRKYKEEII